MLPPELSKLVAELKFMDIAIPDLYERVCLEQGHVVELNLDSVNLGDFPHFPISISKMTRLHTLSLRYNRLVNFPEEILELQQLEILNLDHNFLTSIPDLKQLENLRILRIKDNSLSALPALPNGLSRLHAGKNELNSLPPLPTSLQVLHLPNNNFQSISIEPEKHFRYLNLRSNRLETIPSIAYHGNLEKLNLYNNPIVWREIDYPRFSGTIFTDHSNPFREPPFHILHPRFRDYRFNRNYPPQFAASYLGKPFTSVMFYGDDGVGKKSLIEKYLYKYFVPDTYLYITQNRYLNWDHYVLRQGNTFYQLWFPYSQKTSDPTYRTSILNGFYYSNVVILLFDLSDSESFKTVVKSIWQVYEIRIQNCPIIVVGNKADLRISDTHSWQQIRSYLDNLEMKTGMVLPYLEISVEEESNIEDVFEKLFETMRNQ